MTQNSDKKPSNQDRLLAAEVKAVLSKSDTGVISSATKDSAEKDEYRVSLTLNYMRRKLKQIGKMDESNDILRFQKKTATGLDYKIKYVAAGMTNLTTISTEVIDGIKVKVVPGISGNDLQISTDTAIFLVRGNKLMELAHEIYERCVK